MKLPPISIVNGASHVHEMLYHYGRACAEAALEAAAKECKHYRHGGEVLTAYHLSNRIATAIRSIKIED